MRQDAGCARSGSGEGGDLGHIRLQAGASCPTRPDTSSETGSTISSTSAPASLKSAVVSEFSGHPLSVAHALVSRGGSGLSRGRTLRAAGTF